MNATSGLDFGVLGPLQLSIGGTPVALGTPKQRAVLAMLVMSRNRPVSSDALVAAAWGSTRPRSRRPVCILRLQSAQADRRFGHRGRTVWPAHAGTGCGR
jgi:DNA-binding SARP family transcriptional activator